MALLAGLAPVLPAQGLGDGSDDLGGLDDDLDLGGTSPIEAGADFGDLPDLAPDPLPSLDDDGVLGSGITGGGTRGPPAGAPQGPVLTLADVATRAVAEAAAVKRTRDLVEAARRGIQATDAERWPKVGVSAEFRDSDHRGRIGELLGPELARELERPLSQMRNDNAFVAGFDIKAPLYRAGLFEAREETARHEAEIARLRHLQTVEAVLVEAVGRYLEVLLREAETGLEEARLQALAAAQGEAVAAAATPEVRDTLALEYELKLARVRGRIATARSAREAARESLGLLLGPEAPAGFRLAQRAEVKPVASAEDAVVGKAKEANLEVRILMEEARKAHRKVGEEASAYFPRVDAEYRFRASTPTHSDHVDTEWWEALVKLDYPLFDGGVARSRKRRARVEGRVADSRVGEAARRAEAEARVAFRREREAEGALSRARGLVDLASRHLRSVQDRVDKGSLKPADQARARVALLSAQLETFRLQAEVLRSRARQQALAGQLVLDKF